MKIKNELQKAWMFFISLAFATLTIGTVYAQDSKVALVIGNENYRNFSRVTGAGNDAAQVGEKLEELGFSVTSRKNLNRAQLYQDIVNFSRRAQKSDVSLLYFVGHGAHLNGRSYVAPTDAALTTLLHAGHALMDASLVVDQLGIGEGKSFVIFDTAWRNDIMKDLGVKDSGAALATLAANPDQFILSSHRAKKAIKIRSNKGGHLAEALTTVLDREELTTQQIARRIQARVSRKSSREQTVVFDNRLSSDVVFNPRKGPDPNSAEAILWNTIQGSNDANVFRAYVSQFPNGYYVGVAQQKIAELEIVVEPEPEPEPLRFSVRRMNATYVTKRRSNLRAQPTTESARVGSIGGGVELKVTGKVRNLPWYRIGYGNGEAYIYESLIELPRPADETAWLRVKGSDDVEELQRFINQYPSSSFVPAARQKILSIVGTPVAEPEPEPEISPSSNRYIVTRQGNLRAAPNATSQFLGSVGVGEHVTVLSKVNGLNWYRVRSQGGVTAYIWGRLIEPAPAPVVDNRDKQLWDWAKNRHTIRAYNSYLSQFPNGQFANKAKRRMNRLLEKQSQQESSVRTITVMPVQYRNTDFPSLPTAITQALGGLQNSQVSVGSADADIVVKTEIIRLDITQTADSTSLGLSLGAALLGGRQGSDVLQNLGGAMQNKVKAAIRLTATNRSNGQSIVVDANSKSKSPTSLGQREAAAKALNAATKDASQRLAAEIAQKWGN